MVFRIYKTGFLFTAPECNQMDLLIRYLKREFTNRNEDCSIIVEPHIPKNVLGEIGYRKPDALILKDNMMILIEMKGFDGKIMADCSRWGIWKTKDGESFTTENNNPFHQARFYRHVLIKHLKENFSKDMYLPSYSRKKDFNFHDWVAYNVRSWVITKEASQPELTGILPQRHPWFKILALNKLPQALAFLHHEPLLTPSEKIRLIKSLEAELVHGDEWCRESIVESPISVGLLAKITYWIESGNHENVNKALDRIRELNLKNHINHVIECWHNNRFPDLRKQALLMLIDWQYEKIGSILNEALQDDSPDIVWFTLNYLSQYGHAETLPTLTEILRKGTHKAQVVTIRAIATSGDRSSCTIVFDFTKGLLSNHPFKPFQKWVERIKAHLDLRAKGMNDEEFTKLQQEKANLSELSIATIEALANLGCKESISLVKQIIDKPSSLGFETDDYNELPFVSGFFSIFESACKSLGILGIGDKTVVDLLISKLEKAPEDFQQCIIQALGNVGDSDAEFALLPFVADRTQLLFYDAALALSKLRSNIAFNRIAKAYLYNPLDVEGHWAKQALAKISPSRFEQLLLDQIGAKKNSDEQKAFFLRSLLPVASLRSVPVLFSALDKQELSEISACILGNLSNENEVFKPAMELTYSKSSTEQALGISILESYFMQNLGELEKFKPKEAPVVVRRIISGIYYNADARMKLFEYANDSDEFVRDYVFLKIACEEIFHGCCFVVADSGVSAQCEVAIDKEFLAIKLPEEVLLVLKQQIKYGKITSNEAGNYGVYMEIIEGPNSIQNMLLFPLDRHLGNPMKMSQQLFSKLEQTQNQGDRHDKSSMGDLWAKIPNNLLQN